MPNDNTTHPWLAILATQQEAKEYLTNLGSH